MSEGIAGYAPETPWCRSKEGTGMIQFPAIRCAMGSSPQLQVMEIMGIRLRTRMEEASHLDRLFRQVLQVADYILRFPAAMSRRSDGCAVQGNDVLLVRS